MSSTAFTLDVPVRFRHCDPAGIVFFPRFFEMINDVVEDWFDKSLGLPFAEMLQTHGVPTAEIRTRFTAPSRHGEVLTYKLIPVHLGRTSLRYEMTARCGSDLRLVAEGTLVYVDGKGEPCPWPANVVDRVVPQLQAA